MLKTTFLLPLLVHSHGRMEDCVTLDKSKEDTNFRRFRMALAEGPDKSVIK